MAAIRDDIVEEARRVSEAARDGGVPVRLIGGLAIRLHDDALPLALRRAYADIDLATTGKGAKATARLMQDLGYVANERFNAMNAGRRLVFYDVERKRQVDVFVGDFRMCHRIDLTARLAVDPLTVPLAELLLTKLQIVQLNRKDVLDVAAILHGHEVTNHDDDAVNGGHIARVLAADWGFWRTARGSMETAEAHLAGLGLEESGRSVVAARLERLRELIDASPKSLRWRSRARIGERARWYEEPEEIDHDRTGGRPA